jgi:hypothetical protein
MRRVMIADTRCTELLGRGDVLRPWSMDAAELSSVPIEADWRVADQPAKFVCSSSDSVTAPSARSSAPAAQP